MTDGREFDRQGTYEITVEGILDGKWSDWFNGMKITFGSGSTTLTGAVADQSALRGILFKIWDLNLTLLSVIRIESE